MSLKDLVGDVGSMDVDCAFVVRKASEWIVEKWRRMNARTRILIMVALLVDINWSRQAPVQSRIQQKDKQLRKGTEMFG